MDENEAAASAEPGSTELELRDSRVRLTQPEALLRLHIQAVTDYAIFMLDPGGNVASWNLGAERIKGYKPEEIIGRHMTTFYPGGVAARAHTDDELARARRFGHFEEENWRVRKDGTRFWANVVITPVYDHGVLLGYSKVTRDMTARKRAEDELRQSEERFRLLVDGVRDYAIFTLNPEGIITSWNAGASHIKGYLMDEILGRHFSIFYTPEDLAAKKPEIELDVAARVGRFEDEGLRVRKDGTTFYASVVVTALRGADGILRGFSKITRDITERKRAEERLHEAHRDLERRVIERTTELRAMATQLQNEIRERQAASAQLLLAERMASVGTLAAGIAHEINNPLSFIFSNLEVIEEDLRELPVALPAASLESLLKNVVSARTGAERVRKIVRELRVFARAEEEQRKLVDVRRILDLSISMANNELRHRARVVLDFEAVPFVLADESRLAQVFINLLVNAGQALPEGRAADHEVRIVCRADDEHVVAEVRDTGHGMEREILAQIFDPFFTTKPVGVGTGLGLSICHTIVTAHGGRIEATSSPQGSTFRVLLPIAVNVQADAARSATRKTDATGSRARVLVIDDDAMAGVALRQQLDRIYEVVLVDSGAAALQRIGAGETFEAILCDVMMPTMNGAAVYEAIRALSPGQAARIVFVTGGAFTPGASDFLMSAKQPRLFKPVERAELLDTIRQMANEAAKT